MSNVAAEIGRDQHQDEGSHRGNQDQAIDPGDCSRNFSGEEEIGQREQPEDESSGHAAVGRFPVARHQGRVDPAFLTQRFSGEIAGVFQAYGEKSDEDESPEAEPFDFLAPPHHPEEKGNEEEENPEDRRMVERQMEMRPIHSAFLPDRKESLKF